MRLAVFVLAILTSFASFLHARPEDNSASLRRGEGAPKAATIYAPKPPYPYQARRRRLVGLGIAVLQIDKNTGYVTSVRLQLSTGHKMLDEAALGAFRQWRFKPGFISKAKIPFGYSIKKGVSF